MRFSGVVPMSRSSTSPSSFFAASSSASASSLDFWASSALAWAALRSLLMTSSRLWTLSCWHEFLYWIRPSLSSLPVLSSTQSSTYLNMMDSRAFCHCRCLLLVSTS